MNHSPSASLNRSHSSFGRSQILNALDPGNGVVLSEAVDVRGAELDAMLDAFERGLREFKSDLKRIIDAGKKHAEDMKRLSTHLSGDNPTFPSEHCIDLRERLTVVSTAFRRLSSAEDRVLCDQLQRRALKKIEQMESEVLEPARALVNDRKRQFKRLQSAEKRMSAMQERISNPRPDQRNSERLDRDLQKAIRELREARILKENAEEIAAHHLEMFEFFRVRGMKRLMAEILRTFMRNHIAALETLSPVAHDLRRLNPSDARTKMRDHLTLY